MNSQRVTLTVTAKLDGTGYGTFSTPESAAECIQAILNGSIPWYEPSVSLAGDA
jgi:hypothetical protein